jgi:hypothetical protein
MKYLYRIIFIVIVLLFFPCYVISILINNNIIPDNRWLDKLCEKAQINNL